MKEFIISRLRESADLKLVFAKQATKEVIKAVNIIEKSLKSSGKILIFGNGRSAANAQNIGEDFIIRLKNSQCLTPVILLLTDSDIVKCEGDSVSFIVIFSRLIE